MPKSSCSSQRPHRQRQRRAALARGSLTRTPRRPALDLLHIMSRGLLGGLFGVLIDALRPAQPGSASGRRSRRLR